MSSILKVDEIQNTSGTTGLTVDSGGRVLNPNAVGWFVSKNATQTASAANEVITWEVVSLNQGSGFQTSGGNVNKFVAPVHGLYTCTVDLLSTSTTNQTDVSLMFNDNTNISTMRNAGVGGHETYSMSWVGEMDAGDTLLVNINTSGRQVYGSGTPWSTWCGYLIG